MDQDYIFENVTTNHTIGVSFKEQSLDLDFFYSISAQNVEDTMAYQNIDGINMEDLPL